MKKLLFLGVFIFSFFFFSPSSITAQTCETIGVRCAECDACGYCRGREAAGNWESCAKCLYPSIVPGTDPYADQTLIVQGTIGEKARAVTPALGKYYTQLGCINTNMDSFTNPSSAGGVLNFVLNRLIFPVVGVLAFLSLIYGAFLLATAQRNPEQIARGKSYVVGAIVGLLFVIGVLFIVGFIAGDILKIPGFSTGSRIKIVAAGIRNGGDRDLITDPEIAVHINSKEIGRLVIPGINSSPQLSDYKSYSLQHSTFDPTIDTLSILYINDYCERIYNCGGTGPSANRDIFISSLEVDGKKCLKFSNSADNLDRSPAAYLWWNGTATCLQWS